MKAMILAAGKGTRLAPLTDHQPKPMLPVADKPLIQWQIEALVRAGVTEIVINLHHLGEQIADYLGDGTRFDVRLTYSWEESLLETGGGIVKALPLLGSDPFWLLNGDIWTDFEFDRLPQQLQGKDLAHMLLTPTPAYRDAGDFEYQNARVTSRGTNYVYCGIALLSSATFSVPKSEPRSVLGNNTANAAGETHFSLRDLYFELVATQRVSAQVHEGTWLDIGTLEQYQTLLLNNS